MAETIPGGATKNAAGTWQNAKGEPLTKTQIAAVEALHEQIADDRAAMEAARLSAEAQANPIASALVAALRPQAAETEPPAPKSGK